jgi:hypothetical protein
MSFYERDQGSLFDWDRPVLYGRDRGTSYDRDRPVLFERDPGTSYDWDRHVLYEQGWHVLYEWDWGILLFVLSLVIFAILDLSISGSESISIRVGKHRDWGNIGIGATSGSGDIGLRFIMSAEQ